MLPMFCFYGILPVYCAVGANFNVNSKQFFLQPSTSRVFVLQPETQQQQL